MLPKQLRKPVACLGNGPAGTRDRAMLLHGFGGATRRSEVVALDRADVVLAAQGDDDPFPPLENRPGESGDDDHDPGGCYPGPM